MTPKRRLIRVDVKAAALLDRVKDLCFEVESFIKEKEQEDKEKEEAKSETHARPMADRTSNF